VVPHDDSQTFLVVVAVALVGCAAFSVRTARAKKALGSCAAEAYAAADAGFGSLYDRACAIANRRAVAGHEWEPIFIEEVSEEEYERHYADLIMKGVFNFKGTRPGRVGVWLYNVPGPRHQRGVGGFEQFKDKFKREVKADENDKFVVNFDGGLNLTFQIDDTLPREVPPRVLRSRRGRERERLLTTAPSSRVAAVSRRGRLVSKRLSRDAPMTLAIINL
jgi:hypothetical protein